MNPQFQCNLGRKRVRIFPVQVARPVSSPPLSSSPEIHSASSLQDSFHAGFPPCSTASSSWEKIANILAGYEVRARRRDKRIPLPLNTAQERAERQRNFSPPGCWGCTCIRNTFMKRSPTFFFKNQGCLLKFYIRFLLDCGLVKGDTPLPEITVGIQHFCAALKRSLRLTEKVVLACLNECVSSL